MDTTLIMLGMLCLISGGICVGVGVCRLGDARYLSTSTVSSWCTIVVGALDIAGECL